MAAKRKLKEYNRESKNKKRNRLVLIGTEGSNVTETNYFKHFNTRGIKIIFSDGNATDPHGMIRNIVSTMKRRGIDAQYDDVSLYCVIDTDDDPVRWQKIMEIFPEAKENGIEIVCSTPCFEDWFLCHYEMTTASMTSKDVIKRLKKHIDNYKKNMDVFPKLNSLTEKAIDNAKKQVEYHSEQGVNIKNSICNPSSLAYIVVEDIIGK